MLNEVIKGISMALNTAFGDEYEIRQNDVEQGLVNGSFFIQVLKPELTPLLGRRSMKRNHFDVMYFPKAPGNNADRLKAAELLGKRYGLYTDRVETEVDMDLNITVDYGDDG